MLIYWDNQRISVSEYEYQSNSIPKNFKDFRILHVSDLHNKTFGSKQERLIKEVRKLNPDIIIVTGDLIDRRKFNLEAAMDFINGAVQIAPVYYVSGNHEAWSGKYLQIKSTLEEAKVIVLDNKSVDLNIGDESIQILGVSDPDFQTDSYLEGTNSQDLIDALENLSTHEGFKVLLTHRPELFSIYERYTIDLSFAGHAHGGQFRLPFIGGIIAPDQGFFPTYTQGRHDRGESTLYVSRGLGNSIIPIRFMNPPELVVVTLSPVK